MDLIRQRQKLVFWAVAIIVIPSFVLVWGGSRSAFRSGHSGGVRANVDGRAIHQADFENMRRRLHLALGGARLLCFVPGPGEYGETTMVPDRRGDVSVALAFAYLDLAKEAGVRVAPIEVGTYIRSLPPFREIQDDAKYQEAFEKYLLRLETTSEEYQAAVHDWLLIRKYLDLMDGNGLGSDESAYAGYAAENMTCSWQRLEVPITDAMRKAAQDKILGVTPVHPEGDMEMVNLAVETYLKGHDSDRRFWTKAKWRFEYILAPFEAGKFEVKDEEIKGYFEANKYRYAEKKLEDVKEEIRGELLRERQKESAEVAVKEEVDRHIRECLAKKEPIRLEDALKNPHLAKLGVRVGVSGETPVAFDELRAPDLQGGASGLALFLDRLDELKKEDRDKYIEKLKAYFDNQPRLLETKAGYLRIRLLDYVPGAPRSLKDAKGNVDQALRTLVTFELQKEGASDAAKALAESFRDKLARNEVQGLPDVKTESKPFAQAPGALRFLALNEGVVQPMEKDGQATGFEVLVLRSRVAPPRAAFDALPAAQIERYRDSARFQSRGMVFPYGENVVVRPGPRLHQWTVDAFRKTKIQLFEPKVERNSGSSPFGYDTFD